MGQSKPPVLEIVGSAKKPTAKKGGGGAGSGSGASKVEKFGDYSIKNGAFHKASWRGLFKTSYSHNSGWLGTALYC